MGTERKRLLSLDGNWEVLILFKFELSAEVALPVGLRVYRQKKLILFKWFPRAGFFEGVHANKLG